MLPDLSDVSGRDFRGTYTAEIRPGILQSGRILSKLPEKRNKVDVDRDLPLLVEAMRSEMRAKFGEGFDKP